jgi:hypothetical protein
MSRARARSSSCEAPAVEFGRRVRDLRLRLDAPVSQEPLAEIAGVQRTYKGHLELNRLEGAGPVRALKVGPDTEHLPGSVTATLHSVDERTHVAGFGQIEIDWAW